MNGVIELSIIEFWVLGVPGYVWQCQNCQQEGKPQDTERQAVGYAKRHVCKNTTTKEN